MQAGQPVPTVDLLRPFQLERSQLRGRFVRLGGTVDYVLKAHDYPPAVSDLLGQLLVLAGALAGGLKFAGRFSLQIRADGPVRLLVADCTNDGEMRGYASFDADRVAAVGVAPPMALLGQGLLALSVDQRGDGGELQQGIVELGGDTLADCMLTYFHQSEQVRTGIRVAVAKDAVSGRWHAGAIVMQALPVADARTAPRFRARLGEDGFGFLALVGVEAKLIDHPLAPHHAAAAPTALAALAGGLTAALALLLRLGVRRTPAQRRGGDAQHIAALLQHDVGVGGHAGQKVAARVVGLGDHRVGDHVLLGGRLLAHLGDDAREILVRESVDGEPDLLTLAHLADVGLVDADLHFQLGEVLRQAEQDRRRKAGGHGLARLDGALDDDAVDGRDDARPAEVHSHRLQGRRGLRHAGALGVDVGAGRRHRGPRLLVGGLGLLQHRGSVDVLGDQGSLAVEVGQRHGGLGLGGLDCGLRGAERSG